MDLQRGAVYRVLADRGQWLLGENDTLTCRGEFPGTYVEPYTPEAAMTPHADVALTRGKFEVGVHAVYRLRTFADLTHADQIGTLPDTVDEIAPASEAVCTTRAAAELMRIALVRGAPRTATVAALGVMLEDFAVSCERVARFVGTQDAAVRTTLPASAAREFREHGLETWCSYRLGGLERQPELHLRGQRS